MRTLIRARQVIDGISKRPIGYGAALFEGERIFAVGRAADIGDPDSCQLIDVPHATVMPGLIDAHVHLAYSGAPDKTLFRSEHADLNYAEVALRAAHYAYGMLRYGFTALRDMHAPGGTVIDVARAINRGHAVGPRIKACGRGLSVTGGHMDQPGWADHAAFRDMTHPCDGADDFRKAVRNEIKRSSS